MPGAFFFRCRVHHAAEAVCQEGFSCMDQNIISEVVSTTIKIYAMMTPPAVLSAFISGTRDYDKRRKTATAVKTSLAAFIIGLVLYLFGAHIFALFGFTLDAFRIGSGVLLFLTAVSLMGEEKDKEHTQKEGDISVVPLAIPLCMGPASIGAIMVIGASANTLREMLVGVFSLFFAATGIFLLLLMSHSVERVLHKTGIAVLAKLTGLLLAAIAAQVIFTGMKAFLK